MPINNVKVLRIQLRDWKATQLAEVTGLTRHRLSRIENGRVTPTVYDALKIARALGCTVDELFPLRNEPPQ